MYYCKNLIVNYKILITILINQILYLIHFMVMKFIMLILFTYIK